MQTKELQKEIKETLKKMGWSQKRLAREVFMEESDVDDEDDMRNLEERVKKDLNRSTTKPERLQYYLQTIALAPGFKIADMVIRNYHSTGVLSDELESGMKKISEKLDRMFSD